MTKNAANAASVSPIDRCPLEVFSDSDASEFSLLEDTNLDIGIVILCFKKSNNFT